MTSICRPRLSALGAVSIISIVAAVLDLRCVPFEGPSSVAPCPLIDGQAYTPVVVSLLSEFDGSVGPDLFVWAFSLVGLVFVVGMVVGSIMRVIRSA